MKDEKVFTVNETLSLMHSDSARTLRRLADYIEKNRLTWQEAVYVLRKIADHEEAEPQHEHLHNHFLTHFRAMLNDLKNNNT